MDSKDSTTKLNIQSLQSYSNAIQTMINNQNVHVKIADLGNACYDVSHHCIVQSFIIKY